MAFLGALFGSGGGAAGAAAGAAGAGEAAGAAGAAGGAAGGAAAGIGGAGAGAGVSGAASLAGGAPSAAGFFGASGTPALSDAFGTTFAQGAAPQALSFADKLAAFGSGVKDFGLGVLNPAGGSAANNIATARGFNHTPATGDMIQLIVQNLLNNELGKSVGPFRGAMQGYAQLAQRPRPQAAPGYGTRAKQTD